MTDSELYRDFIIEPASYPPGWWCATHKDYDGPEDSRYFVERTRKVVMESVDAYWEEQE